MVQFGTEKKNVFHGIITSQMRVQILMRLFLNPEKRAYIREMASEFGASPGQVREELGQLSSADIIRSERVGRQVYYRANEKHALFPELNAMVRKALGMDRILESILQRLGNLERAALIDDYAEGKDSGIIDLVILGKIEHSTLNDLIQRTEKYVGRKIRTLVYDSDDTDEFQSVIEDRASLLVWDNGVVQIGRTTNL